MATYILHGSNRSKESSIKIVSSTIQRCEISLILLSLTFTQVKMTRNGKLMRSRNTDTGIRIDRLAISTRNDVSRARKKRMVCVFRHPYLRFRIISSIVGRTCWPTGFIEPNELAIFEENSRGTAGHTNFLRLL